MVCGWNHTLILVSPNFVYSTGVNKYGELGIQNFTTRKSFSLIESLLGKNVIDIFAGGYHSWFLFDFAEPISQFDPPSPLANSVSESFSDNESRLNKNTKNFSQFGVESIRKTSQFQMNSEKHSIRPSVGLSDNESKSREKRSLLPNGNKSIQSFQEASRKNDLNLLQSEKRLNILPFRNNSSNPQKQFEAVKEGQHNLYSKRFGDQSRDVNLYRHDLIDLNLSNSMDIGSQRQSEMFPLKINQPFQNYQMREENLLENSKKNLKNVFFEDDEKSPKKQKTESALEFSKIKNDKNEPRDLKDNIIGKKSSKLLDDFYFNSNKSEHSKKSEKTKTQKTENYEANKNKIKQHEKNGKLEPENNNNNFDDEKQYYVKKNFDVAAKSKINEDLNTFGNKISFGNNEKHIDKSNKDTQPNKTIDDKKRDQKDEHIVTSNNDQGGSKKNHANTENDRQIKRSRVESNSNQNNERSQSNNVDRSRENERHKKNVKQEHDLSRNSEPNEKAKKKKKHEHDLSLNNDRNFYLLLCKLDYCHRFAIIFSEKSKSNVLKNRINEYIDELKMEDPKISLWSFVTSDEFKMKKTNALVESIISQNENSNSNSHVLMMISSSDQFNKERHSLNPTDYKKFNPVKSDIGDIYSLSEIDIKKDRKLKLLGYWYLKLKNCLNGVTESIEFMELRSASYM